MYNIEISETYTVYYKIEGDDTHEDSAVSSFDVTIEGLTVTANVNGTEVTVNAESTLERPADPTREGYDFGGWYADEACTTAYNFNAPVGTSGATLYPQWIPIEYTLTEGGEVSWTRGGSEGLVFRAVRTNNGEATFDHFTGVKVDNNTLGDNNYDAVSGSVIVTLTPAYLATLAYGQHTLEIMFDDGSSVTTTFTIAAQVVETTETTVATTETTAAATGVASTGENQVSSTAPIGIAVLLIAGDATMIFVVRKNEENS
ncbi:MAG: InlB B-repeat-containing protein [Saccharofermentans sp.]|nr:InlB B-repeat-containing protein [Saccharofermentans sp.]